MSGYRPTRPLGVGECFSYVKYVVRVNRGRGIVGGGLLEVNRGLFLETWGHVGRKVSYPAPSLQGVSIPYLEVQPVRA